MARTKTKNYCIRCDFRTNHTILFNKDIRSDNEDYDYQINYMTVECNGCNRVSFREEFVDIDGAYPDQYGNWEPETTVKIYPLKLSIDSKLEDLHILPEQIRIVYKESIDAFNANSLLLTGVGFRAIIEAICIDKKVAGRDLAKKINNLVKQKLITEKEAERLHSIRFLGNDSVHEMSVPSKEKLLLVLNIINHLLSNIYIIDFQSKNKLETVIGLFPEFKDLLDSKLTKLNKGDEVPLASILEKSIRRLNGKFSEFEIELIKQINEGNYSELSIGKIDSVGNRNNVQHFIIE